MAGFNNPTGFGNSPTGFGPKPMPGQAPGAASPAVEALKQTLAAKQAGSRADMLEKRANIISPGNSSLFTGPMDAWLAQNERDKQTAASEEAMKQTDAKEMAARHKKAKGMAQVVLAQYGDQKKADAVYEAVMGGADIDIADLAPPTVAAPKARRTQVVTIGENEVLFDLDTGEPIKVLGKAPTGAGDDGEKIKSMADMPAEQRTKVGLIHSSAKLVEESLPKLFSEDGDWSEWSAKMPGSQAKIAVEDLRQSLIQTLRSVSGAAIPDTEIEREVDDMIPTFLDSDQNARAKVGRIKDKLKSLYTAQTSGYNVPEELSVTFGPMPWETDEAPAASKPETMNFPTADAAQAAAAAGEIPEGTTVTIGE